MIFLIIENSVSNNLNFTIIIYLKFSEDHYFFAKLEKKQMKDQFGFR